MSPLADSGAALFAGEVSEFVDLAPASKLTAHLTREFNRRWGTVAESEIHAWRASLTALSRVAGEADLPAAGVGVELKLPLTDKRVDVSFVGRDTNARPSVVLVELKQWDVAGPSLYPDNVVVGGREMLHPGIQVAAYAQYLRDSHSAFTEDGFALTACAYLHNMEADVAASLAGSEGAEDLTPAPLYTGDDDHALVQLLGDQLRGGGGLELLPKIVHGRYRPSLTLLEGIRSGLSGRTGWTLLDEQRIAFNLVKGRVERAYEADTKAVIMVLGGPGTGKSVIAAHVALALGLDGKTVVHTTGSKAFTTNLRALAPKGRSGHAFFRYFNDFRPAKTAENEIDVLIADEAHRLRKTSNDRFTAAHLRSELSQIDELLRASRVAVFFLDQRQNVRPKEIGSPDTIRSAAAAYGAEYHEVHLTGQFRCSGCAPYVDWVDALMSDEPKRVGSWLDAGEYEVRVFDDPATMERELVGRARQGASARLVAGFCWEWSDPEPDGTLVNDVRIGSWRRPWNEKPPEQRRPPKAQPRPALHPYTRWATEPERIREVGCIYSAQGFEFDCCGVILGDDLVWRDGRGWVAQPGQSRDPEIRRSGLTPDETVPLLQHTYRVLLTRGIRSTFIYSTDQETRALLSRLLSG